MSLVIFYVVMSNVGTCAAHLHTPRDSVVMGLNPAWCIFFPSSAVSLIVVRKEVHLS